MASQFFTPTMTSLPRSLTLTEHAKKYGESKEAWLKGTGKSGLTPLGQPIYPILTVELFYRYHLREYQKYETDGYDTDHLILSGAVEEHGIRASNLDLNNIHPLFRRERWEEEDQRLVDHCPIQLPASGEYWVASNDTVWNVLLPILALTSKFITHSNYFPWWDALFFGPRKDLEFRQGFKDPLRSFSLRPSEERTEDDVKAEQEKFNALAKILKFGITSGQTDPTTGLPDEGTWAGLTEPESASNEHLPKIWLDSASLDILASTTLTPPERLIAQFNVAITLLHEVAHAVSIFSRTRDGELYFEDEAVAEVGFSMINGVFRGIFTKATDERSTEWFEYRGIHPMALIYTPGYPKIGATYASNLPCLDEDLENDIGTKDTYPVPLSWISDIQQEVFWDLVVPVYGRDLFVPNPLLSGIQQTGDGVSVTHVDLSVRPNRLDPGIVVTDDLVKEYSNRGAISSDDANADLRERTRTTAIAMQNRNHRIALEQNAAHTIYGAVGIAPFGDMILPGNVEPGLQHNYCDPDEAQKVFISSPSNDNLFRDLKAYLIEMRYRLKLDTLFQWTTSNSLLWTINHERLDRPVFKEDWYKFLVECKARGQLFDFRRVGYGIVRKIDAGWPPALDPIYGADPDDIPYDGPADKQELIEGMFIKLKSRLLSRRLKEEMFNPEIIPYYPIQMYIEHLLDACEGFLARNPDYSAQIGHFDENVLRQALRHCMVTGRFWAPAPHDCVRRIRPGWIFDGEWSGDDLDSDTDMS